MLLPGLQDVLEVVAGTDEEPSPAAGFPESVLRRLTHLVPCDVVSYTDMDLATGASFVQQDVDDHTNTVACDSHDSGEDPFFGLYMSTLSCSYPTRTGDVRSVTQRSDFYSDREWRATPIYREYFAAVGVEHCMFCCLEDRAGTRTRRVMLFRSATGFTEDERQVLALLRPHLAGVLRRHEPVRADPLTDRHWELLRLVAAGHTNSQIATALHLSPHTVRTHLEHVYARLQVRSRAEAVTYAFGGRGTAAQSLD